MDFFLYIIEHAVDWSVASVPLILVFLQLKIFRLPLKSIASCLSLNLLVSVFFWLKLKDVHVALYQSIPYISSFIWIWAENVLRKRHESNNNDSN